VTAPVHSTDRRLTVVMILSGILAAGMIVLFVVAVPAIFSSKDNSSQVRQGNELAACRSEFNARVVEAQDKVEEARDGVDDARADRDNLVLMGLAASATGDDAFLATLAQATPAVIDAIAAARVVKNSARSEKEEAVRQYAAAVRRSSDDPIEFLAECQKGN